MFYEITINDFVEYAWYFDTDINFIACEHHKIRGELINPIREGYEYRENVVNEFKAKESL